MDDWDLLEQFRLARSEPAFAELVRRHAGFVLATCRRRSRDSHLSEDVAQAVFLALARRPPVRSASSASLAGWLYRTAVHACNNAMQARRSRDLHERRAAAQAASTSNDMPAIATAPSDAEVLLDQALAELSSRERDAVLLRYYQDHSVQQVGAALGISQNTATKRITRAIERMREFLAGRGLVMAAPALVEAITNATRSSNVPVDFVAKAVAVASGKFAASTLVEQLAEGVNQMIRIAKIKLVAAVAAIVISGGGLIAMNQLFAKTAEPKPAASTPVAATQPAVANTPKQALKEFAAAVRKGDASRLPEMAVVETDEERELIRAACAYTDATGSFSAAVADKFGAEAKKELDTLFELTPIGRFTMFIETTVDQAPETIDGNVASIQPPGVEDLTFWLVNVDGKWKLSTQRMCERWTPDEWRERIGLMNMAAGGLHHFTEGVASGKYATLAELKRDIAPILRQNR